MWHLYMIRTGNGSLYTGVATDVARRLAEHRAGGRKCARYLRGKAPLSLVFQKRVGGRSAALRAEWRLRRLPKGEKETIVRSNPSRKRLLKRLGVADDGGDLRPSLRTRNRQEKDQS